MSISAQLRKDLIEARRQVWQNHHGDPNFTGCGIGYRRKGGKVTDEPVVVAMVVDKLPAGEVSSRRLLPATVRVNGVDHGVDVVEAGPVHVSGLRSNTAVPMSIETHPSLIGKYRPLVMGCGLSINKGVINLPDGVKPENPPIGSLGCVLAEPNSDASWFLTAGHVLAGGVDPPDPNVSVGLLQPAAADGGDKDPLGDQIATVTDVVTLDTTPGSTDNTIDAGLALAPAGSAWVDPGVADNLMAPISATHPAVGMCVADDYGGNSFLSRMDSTLAWVHGKYPNLTLLGAPSPSTTWTTPPEVGMNIEKVGRTSAYTSSTVDATDVIVVTHWPSPATNKSVPVTMSGMIWSQYLTADGDSGAVACAGGDGQTYVLPVRAWCPLMHSVQSYYALPSPTTDNALTNKMQAQVLSQTLVGNLIIGMVYENKQVVIDRLAASTGTDYNQATAQAFFQSFYAKYRPVITAMLSNPSSFSFTTDMAQDSAYFFNMLFKKPADGGQGIVSIEEAVLVYGIAATVVGFAQNNYSYQQFMAYCDEPDNLAAWRRVVAAIPTLTSP